MGVWEGLADTPQKCTNDVVPGVSKPPSRLKLFQGLELLLCRVSAAHASRGSLGYNVFTLYTCTLVIALVAWYGIIFDLALNTVDYVVEN